MENNKGNAPDKYSEVITRQPTLRMQIACVQSLAF
jgi:hypothetical protein